MAYACSTTENTFRPDASVYKREYTYAIPQTVKTSMGKALAKDVKKHDGKSGFHLLKTGSESLDMRLGLVRAAEKTLDLQYYAIHDDTTSNLLLEAVLRAADRGVRVRFLIDGISMKDVGNSLSALDSNKNISIRVFNPIVTRDQPFLSQIAGRFFDLGYANKRMHNKALIADNQMAIIGGRNLGDEYFDANADVNFKDLDILAAGPATAYISRSFDRYWNSDNSFPIATLRRPKTDSQEIEKTRHALQEGWEKKLATQDGKKLLTSRLADRLKDAEMSFVWAQAELSADDPAKLNQAEGKAESKPIMRMAALLDKAHKEFVVVSPYLVPTDEGVDWLTGFVKRGMKVRMLTNSLASTDVVLVHTGYRRYRKDLIKGGIELYELKPIDGERPKQRLFGSSAPAYASLHSKVYVIDRKELVIGSFNLDPRSWDLNTELALIIHSPELSAQVLDMFKESISPDTSYHLALQGDDIVWMTREKGRDVTYKGGEPKAGLGRRLQLFFMSVLPVEDQL